MTKPALDPTSRMPEFKVCAVRARAATPADEDASAEVVASPSGANTTTGESTTKQATMKGMVS